jgi:oligogalacturonide transporter
MYLCTFVSLDIVLSLVIYFITYHLRIEESMNLLLGTLLVVQMGGIPLYYSIAKRKGKITAYLYSSILWAGAMATSLLLQPGVSRLVLILFGALVGLGTSGSVLMVWSIFSDVPDVDELASGKRREGIYSGLFTFLRKASSALALFLVSNLLAAAGYRAPETPLSGGNPVVYEQNPLFLIVLRLMFALIPVIFIAVALVAARRFPLTQSMHSELGRLLRRRRSGESETDAALETRLRSKLLGAFPSNRSDLTKAE